MTITNINRQIEIAAARNIKEYEYWMDKLSGEPVKSCFPCDYKKSDAKKTGRDVATFRLEDEPVEKLVKLSKGSPHTQHIILLAVLIALLGKYTGNDDILVGTPIYRQEKEDNFINTLLVLRCRLQAGISVKELLIRVRQTIAEANENQAYPVELLPGKLGLPVPESGSAEDFPLFDVVLLLQEIHDRTYLRKTAPNIVFSFKKRDRYVEGEVEYNTSRYREVTIEQIIRHFTRLLQTVLANPDAAVLDIEILSQEEKKQLLIDFNDTDADYPDNKTIRELFEEQVQRKPGNTALVGAALCGVSAQGTEAGAGVQNSVHEITDGNRVLLTYRDFDRTANQLAGILLGKGVESGTIVGIMLDRSIEMVVGIFAILKAGGAYLPIDPDYPRERIGYILSDSSAKVLLTSRSLNKEVEKLRSLEVETIFVEDISIRQEAVGIRENQCRGESMYSPVSRDIEEVEKLRSLEKDMPGHVFKEPATCNLKPVTISSNLCYIIYTSGSTGKPKGVIVRHNSVVNIITTLQQLYPLEESDTYLLKTSYVFDVSAAELFGWFPAGGKLAVLEKGSEKEPKKILAAIQSYAVTHINFVPSMFNVFVDELDARNIANLAGLKYIFLAGEALLPELVNKFTRFDTHIKLENIYGPTEGTVYTSNYSLSAWEGNGSIPIGRPMQNIKLYILDKENNLHPIGAAGELCISGENLARGYLNNPELTAEKFITEFRIQNSEARMHLKNSEGLASGGQLFEKSWSKTSADSNIPSFHHSIIPVAERSGAKLYRTGDLTRWNPDGDIEFLGRIDQQVKIRGFRVELGEIENQLLKHEQIKEAVVLADGHGETGVSLLDRDSGEKYLCAYIVAERKAQSADQRTQGKPGDFTVTGLREYLARTLPDYMIPSYFVSLERIPLTPNGKVDRRALPEIGLTMLRKEYAAPGDEVEKKLAEIWSDVLGTANLAAPAVGIDDNFFELGGHSLKATRMMARMHRELRVKLEMSELFNFPTIRGIARYIKGLKKERFVGIEAAEEKLYYPLSSAQKRLYILQRIDPTGTGYNMPAVFLLEGDLEKEKFAGTFKKLIRRHESLRTSFRRIDEEPFQQIHDPEDIEFNIEYNDSNFGATSDEAPLMAARGAGSFIIHNLVHRFIRPFDLSCASLLRVGLIPLEDLKHVLMVDMHHIISDGTSSEIFTRDFMTLYAGEELSPLRLHYKDYSEWQNSEEQEESLAQQEAYWQEKFAGEIPVLDLPADYPRPAVQSFAGRNIFFEIGPRDTASLNHIALEQGATLYMVLLAVYNILLAKLSGQEDIVLGAPTAGRRHADLETIIGMFINTLSMRNFPAGDKTFRNFLQEVKTGTLEAFENQEYQFEDLVEKVEVNRDVSRNPLFDVMFALQNMEIAEVEIPGLKLSPYEYENRKAKFDMTLLVFEVGEHLSCNLEYCTALFKEETISRFIDYFKNIVAFVCDDVDVKIADINIMSEEERNQVLYDFNDTGPEYPKDKTIHELFRDQVLKAPDNIAVAPLQSYQSGNLTYRQLDGDSGQLAYFLVQQGVKANDLVAILAESSIEMIFGILGILKASCGYVPLNPRAPVERTKYILAECGVTLLLTTRSLFEKVEKFRSLEVETFFLEDCRGKPCVRPTLYSPDLSDQECRGESMYSPDLSDQECRGESLYSPEKAQSKSYKALRSAPCAMRSASSPENLAYVIFTSGSTGKPKGVPITHANLSPLLFWGFRNLTIGSGDRTLQNLSYYFDWSVWEIFITLTTGACLYTAPDDVLLNPEICIDFMTAHQITVLHITPTRYQYMSGIDKKTATLKYLFIGAEKLPYDLVERSFALVNKDCRVFNMYGPTETTIIAAVLEIDRKEYKNFALLSSFPIGRPIGNADLLVLDKSLKLSPVNVTGELYIAGDGLSGGYLNDPGKSCTVFVENVYEAEGINGKRLYRTGDLARWLPDGFVEFLGRVDHQVKIRGFRIEPGEIENHLLEHEKVKEAVVIDRENEAGEQYLCAYLVSKSAVRRAQSAVHVGANLVFARDAVHRSGSIGAQDSVPSDDTTEQGGETTAKLREFLSRSLPDYMIPSYFVWIDHIPLNPNGKLDRRALPEPEEIGTAEFTAPRDRVEEELAVIWGGVLNMHRDSIGIDNSFFELGGHSIKATLLMSRIQKKFNIDLPLTEIFKRPTIRGMARYIEEAEKKRYASIPAIEEREYYPVSSAQKRMFILNRLKGDNTSDNTPDVFLVDGKLEQSRFEEVVNRLIKRHEALRTSFELLDDEVIQRVHRQVDFRVSTVEVAPGEQQDKEIEKKIGDFIRPFDLGEAPLFKVGLLRLSPDAYVLMYDIHHIIRDGTASVIFIREFVGLYNDEPLPALRIQYKDFSLWQNRLLHSEFIKKQEEYWVDIFSADIPVLNMPTDFPRPSAQSFDGDCIEFELDQELSQRINRLALQHNATLYMVLLSVYTILLSKYSGQEDIVVGTPIAGRPHYDLENLIGMFVNTLAMRNYPKGELSFARFLEEVKNNSLEAYKNQDYQFEELVNTLGIQPDPGRQSLFDTMFAVQNVNVPRFTTTGREVGDLEFKLYKFENKVTQFDIMFHAFELNRQVSFKLLYCTRLFKEETIRMLIRNFKEIICSVVENSDIRLKDIKICHELFDKEINMPQTDFEF